MTQNIDEIRREDVEKIVLICNELEVGFVVKEGDVEISRFDTGFVSTIYLIQFLIPNPPTLPPSIVIKFYATDKTVDETGYQITESQVNNLVIGQSPSRISPKVLLIKPDSIVWEYIDSRAITKKDDQNPEFRAKLAVKLAQFHALKVPVKRNDHKEQVKFIFDDWLNPEMVDSVYSGALNSVFKELELKNILTNNLRAEADYVRDLILNLEKPYLVFGHKDFNHANILLEISGVNEGEIRLIDFDYSSYFYRGCDIGRYFANCTQSEQFHSNDLISDSIMLEFIESYLEECNRIFGQSFVDDPRNSPKKILSEAKLFVLYAYWIDINFSIWMANKSVNVDEEKKKEFVIFADTRFYGYLKVKARFQADGFLSDFSSNCDIIKF